MQRLRLKPKEERRLLRGYLWAYRNEFAAVPELADGEVVDVAADKGRFIGRGFFQAEGGIAVRLLTRHEADINRAWFATQVNAAKGLRDRLYPDADVYRWVHAESDALPGFVADRYGTVVSAQTTCGFYAPHADALAEAFMAHDGVQGVVVKVGDEEYIFGDVPDTVEVELDQMRIAVDVLKGQKTGLFLDQRENSAYASRFMSGARVLDCHCYTGVWSCRAALAGAEHVLGIDTSEKAIEMARHNAELNGVTDRCTFERADAADVMHRGGLYGAVILDPPALARARAKLNRAMGLYQALNRDALKVLEPGGLLVTSSCSHFVSSEAFFEMLKRAGRSAQRQLLMLAAHGAPADHPVRLAMPETAYLTCVALEAE